MYGKPLAHIERIKKITPIKGADNIELATILDWTVVVKKNEFHVDDLVVYIEIGSIVPNGLSTTDNEKLMSLKAELEEAKVNQDQDGIRAMSEKIEQFIKDNSKYPWFEFLRSKKFKINTMILRKFNVISQGICFNPLEIGLKPADYEDVLGYDVTKKLGITELIEDEEEAGVSKNKRSGLICKKLRSFEWFRKLEQRFKHKDDEWLKEYPEKSDEVNVQKIFSDIKEKYGDLEWIVTEKLEGQNISIASKHSFNIFGKKKTKIYINSRNRFLGFNDDSQFTKTVKAMKIPEKLSKLNGEYFIRGEHLGQGIQKNIYNLLGNTIRFFDVYVKVNRKFVKMSFEQSKKFIEDLGLDFVPVLDTKFRLLDSAQEMLEYSNGKTVFGNDLKRTREGVVLRLPTNQEISFKVKNPYYKL